MSKPAQWRPTTPEEDDALDHLARVRFLPASFDKRLIRNLREGPAADRRITDRQAAQLWRILIRYRRQHRAPADLLAYAAKRAAPDLRRQSAAMREQAEINRLKAAYVEAMKGTNEERRPGFC